MVLNPDCVRDVLLCIESCNFGECLTLDSLSKKLPTYTHNELWYTCLKLEEGGYIDMLTFSQIGSGPHYPNIKQINGLTFWGHEFLNSIRADTVWDKTKEIAKKAGIFSLESIGEIAKKVASTVAISALQHFL